MLKRQGKICTWRPAYSNIEFLPFVASIDRLMGVEAEATLIRIAIQLSTK